MSEYSIEAEIIADKLVAGEPLKTSVYAAFKESAEIELGEDSLVRICRLFELSDSS